MSDTIAVNVVETVEAVAVSVVETVEAIAVTVAEAGTKGDKGDQGPQGLQGIQGPPGVSGSGGGNIAVQASNPALAEPGLWIQTGLGAGGADMTFWVEDGN